MTKLVRALFFLTLILSACSPAALSPEVPPAAVSDTPTSIPAEAPATEMPSTEIIPISTTEVLPPAKIIATVSTPHIDPGPDGAATVDTSYPRQCGYQWAYQDLPELSSEFQQSIQALQPDAQAVAFGFGEDCVYADGTKTFIPMETDFNVTIPLSDTTDTAILGEWVVRIMRVIEEIPPAQIVGPRPGRVSILFENVQREGVNFYIDQYHALPAGLTPAEIYQTLKSTQ
jgi:hypothetical protein